MNKYSPFVANRERVVTSSNGEPRLMTKLSWATDFGGAGPVLGGGSVVSAPPKFYSPLHTPSNWQIPQKRQEVYVWCRFFATMEPKVAAALDFYSQFTTNSGFDNECTDKIVGEYFDKVKKNLKLEEWAEFISYEYFSIGDVFMFSNIDCPKCGGGGLDFENGEVCRHKGGTIGSVTMLNPDWVEVQHEPTINFELVYLIPDQNLRNLVLRNEPRELAERIPDSFKQKIMDGQPILANPMCVHHFAHNRIPYQAYGRSLLYRLFATLAYKDKLRQAQWIVADRHIVPIRIVKVGSPEIVATQQDIQQIQSLVYNAVNDPNFTLVTHHALDYDFVGATGKVLQLNKEYDMITEEILDGLMINKALLNSEGPSYSNAAIGIEAMNKRLNSLRKKIAYWIEEKIYKPIALMQGFVDKNERGELVPVYPTVKWQDQSLRDDSAKKNMFMTMADKGYISVQTLLAEVDLDYDVEVERRRAEQVINKLYGIGEDSDEGGNLDFGGGGLDFGGGGGGGGKGGGSMDFGGKGQNGANDMGGGGGGLGSFGPGQSKMPTPGGGPGGDLSAPESQPLSESSQQQDWLDKYYGLPSRLKIPDVRKNNNFRDILSRIKNEKSRKEREIEELQNRQLKAQEVNTNEDGKITVPRIPLSRPEWKLFSKLQELQQNGSLNHGFTIQYPVSNTRMSLDFAFPKLKLAIEVDGPQHALPGQIESDTKKDEILRKHGWTVLRFSSKQIMDGLEDKVLPELAKVIKSISKEVNK